jgi:competence protein ComEC
MDSTTRKIRDFLILPLGLAISLVFIANRELQPDYLLHVNFYDVGQGDAIFIETYLGNQILIDGGPGDQVVQELGYDLPFYDRTIDLVILTHPHADHVGGLVDVVKRYKVKKVLLPEIELENAAYKKFLALIEEKNIEMIYAQEGQRIYLDNATVFDVYFPAGEVVTRDPNDASIFGKLSFGASSFLLTGDAGFSIENQLLTKYNLDVDVLKVGHHGSRFSTSTNFLNEVAPEWAVISVGKNSYGHPTQDTLNNLDQSGTVIFRTDQDQTIRFVSDGTNLYKR